jgi:alkylation response protein AidB-like acyl-CoA dehydrogenase
MELLGVQLVLLWIVMILLCVTQRAYQFDKPIAGTQLQQKKLAEMITNH